MSHDDFYKFGSSEMPEIMSWDGMEEYDTLACKPKGCNPTCNPWLCRMPCNPHCNPYMCRMPCNPHCNPYMCRVPCNPPNPGYPPGYYYHYYPPR